jgi:hypothetical protein
MSTSEDPDTPEEVAEGSREPSNESESTDSIWGTRLQQGQIRLFNIEMDESDKIRGTLEVFEHKSAPTYIAQSYVCGEGECDFKITVNGTAHYIKSNLSIALRQTKRALQPKKLVFGVWARTTWLWIDAICIDQTNVTELELQIRFMEHIYRGANSTFVSLGEWSVSHRLISRFVEWQFVDYVISCEQKDGGPRSTDDNKKMDSANSLRIDLEGDIQTRFSMSPEDIRNIRDKSAGKDVDSSSQAFKFVHPFWQACLQIFGNDWFTRMWTYQELILSQKVFVTFPTCVPWAMLLHWLENIPNLQFPTSFTAEEDILIATMPTNSYYDHVNRHLFHNLRIMRPPSIDCIWPLLAVTSQRRAKLPKDHIFAMFALMDDKTQSLVDVNYSKTDAQVFQDFFELALGTENAARMLPALWELTSWVPTTTCGLPSWLPDLKNGANVRMGQLGMKMISEAVSDSFCDVARLRVLPGTGVIFLKVSELDVVSIPGVAACPAWMGVKYHDSHAISETLLWFKCLCNTLSSSGEGSVMIARIDDFVRYTSGVSEDRRASLLFFMLASQHHRESLALDELIYHASRALLSLPVRDYVKLTEPNPGINVLHECLDMISGLLRRRLGDMYVFATTEGRLGYSPKPVSPGDRICIVPGPRRLHIFSPAPSRYITCAAVQGLMEDNLLDFVRESGREWEEIAIH